MPENKLFIENITKSFPLPGGKRLMALKEVSVCVRQHEIVSLIGPSGCGKSTLLDLVAGLDLPDGGEVFMDGQPITGKKGFISYMPQKDVLFPWRTILENVMLPFEVVGANKSAALAEAKALMPVFGLDSFGESYPQTLSGGMKQRASFLRTYLCKKEVMLLDEPFGKLDALTRLQLQQWILDIWQKFRQTVLFVTHDIDEAILLSDRIYVFSARPGEIIAEVEVGFPRPRSSRLAIDPAFMAIKARLLQLLEEGVFREGEVK